MTATATKIPALRFPEFEGEWVENTLENLFSFKNGLNKEKEYFGRGTPIVNFKDVFNESDLNKANIKGLVEVTDKEKANYSANKGDVFFTRTSETIEEIGIAAVLSEGIEDCVFSGFVLRARPKNHTLVDLFKKYCFSISSVRKEIVTKSSFTTRALTSGTLLNKVVIIYPSSNAEQQKIATFITTIDTRIQQLSRKKALLEQYKKGVMQQIFSQEIRFKDEEGKEFPAWEEKKLGDLCSTFKSGIGITSENIYEIGEFAVYGGNGLRGYTNVYTHEGFFVLIGRQGALCGNVNRVMGKSYISEHAIAVSGNEQSDTEWLAQRLDFWKLNRLSESSAQPGLAVNKLIKLNLSAPSLPEQQKIASFLSTLDRQINQVAQQLERMQAFKKGLLQQMFV